MAQSSGCSIVDSVNIMWSCAVKLKLKLFFTVLIAQNDECPWSLLYSILLYKMNQDFLKIDYIDYSVNGKSKSRILLGKN